jgi:isopenicillin-N epimerase
VRSLKEYFLLDPTVIFLNHGSFGATPKPVFEAYQAWQLRLERQPVLFLGREFNELLLQSRITLGKYLNADADDLVYIPNATHGVNVIARALNLGDGDEILTTDHEYGACDYTWDFLCGKTGARYIHRSIPVPVCSEDDIVEQFWQGVTAHTKAVYLSHITSPTALRLPVEKICALAKPAGIVSIIDAAHSPGQIPVDLKSLDADVVFGNCHKWMLGPKGAAFLYVRRELQDLLEPLIVSWGYQATKETTNGSRFVDLFQWTGTNDPAAALAVPAAIQFMQEHNWDRVRSECHALLRGTLERICDLTGLPPLYGLDSSFYAQMGVAPLPHSNLLVLKNRLYDEYGIEVPLIEWNEMHLIRVSVQAYNDPTDVDALLDALNSLLPQVAL